MTPRLQKEISMLKQLAASMLLLVAILSASARAQEQQGPSDDQMAMMQAMQPLFQTMMQNMAAKGIDPGQFFQQMQNGVDPAEIQKQLIDQGLIDQKTLDQVQANVQGIMSNSIKRRLEATDEEWKTLWPLIQKVMTASAAVSGGRGGPGMMGGGLISPPSTPTDLTKATRALRDVLKDPGNGAGRVAAALKDYRDARAKAAVQLEAARQDLIATLTVRQEATLADIGILE
jgi:hypothetical protein